MMTTPISMIMPLVEQLSGNAAVDCILPMDHRYAEARLIYNRMHDAYPSLIVRTLDIVALRQVIAFAAANQIAFAVRGGGHHIGGFGTCHHGIVIDFSQFKGIEIDVDNHRVAVEPGVCLGDLDATLSQAGYIVPTGTVSQTGVAGLTLGGGIGWLIGQYALTCDQLCGADVLLASGEVVRAEDPAHQDLLWALRGGGGNFGIVLKFRYNLHPLPRTICGMGVVAWSDVLPVMQKILPYLNDHCPPTMTVAPILTKDHQGNLGLRIDFCCANGSDDEVTQLLELSQSIQWSEVREWSFAAWQKAFDMALLPPMRGYWKASYVEHLTLDSIQTLCHAFEHAPALRSTIMIEHLHGAFKQYDERTSAFPLRQSNFGIVFAVRWENSNQDVENITWVRQSFHAIDPTHSSKTYLNYTHEEDVRAVKTLLSSNQTRLAAVKAYYDPHNLFKRNHNVLPNTMMDRKGSHAILTTS